MVPVNAEEWLWWGQQVSYLEETGTVLRDATFKKGLDILEVMVSSPKLIFGVHL